MSLILEADDIRPGMYVSVLSLKTSNAPAVGVFKGEKGRRERPESEGRPSVPPGIPLRVLEASLPFVACCILAPDGTETDLTIIDVRGVTMCRLKRRFVQAIKRFGALQEGEETPQAEEESVMTSQA